MRNPNGYGSVYKLSGKRRKPYCARITDGFKMSQNNKCIPVYKYIGYYETQKDAMQALADYHKNPYNIEVNKITFGELFKKWSADKYPNISKSNINSYNAAYNTAKDLENIPIKDVRLTNLQHIIDTCGKNYPTLKKIKLLFTQIFEFCVRNEIIDPTRNIAQYVDVLKYKDRNPKKYDRKPFTSKEIKLLWSSQKNEYGMIPLMLMYSGVRISELLDLKKEDVFLDKKYFKVIASKTEAGIRTVPIADKVLPFFEYWYNKNDCKYLLSTPDAEHFLYRNYYDSYWIPYMVNLDMGELIRVEGKKKLAYKGHKPHDTRHTCISLLTKANVDERIIQKIVGHSGKNVTETVYTHVDIEQELKAINLI